MARIRMCPTIYYDPQFRARLPMGHGVQKDRLAVCGNNQVEFLNQLFDENGAQTDGKVCSQAEVFF